MGMGGVLLSSVWFVLLIAVISRGEAGVWTSVVAALVLGWFSIFTFPATAAAAAIPLILQGRRLGGGAGTRLFTGAILMFSFSLIPTGCCAPFPVAPWPHLLLASTAMAALAWRRRSSVPLVVAATRILAQSSGSGEMPWPSGTFQWGIILLLLGFSALLLGVAVSLKLQEESG